MPTSRPSSPRAGRAAAVAARHRLQSGRYAGGARCWMRSDESGAKPEISCFPPYYHAAQRTYPDYIFPLSAVPHDWLFPQIDAVVHHGGAGTTAAGTPPRGVACLDVNDSDNSSRCCFRQSWTPQVCVLGCPQSSSPSLATSSSGASVSARYARAPPVGVGSADST